MWACSWPLVKKKPTKFPFLHSAREFCVTHDVHFQLTMSFPCIRTLTVHIANKMKQCFNKLSNSIVASNNNKLLNPCTVHYKLVINFIFEKYEHNVRFIFILNLFCFHKISSKIRLKLFDGENCPLFLSLASSVSVKMS